MWKRRVGVQCPVRDLVEGLLQKEKQASEDVVEGKSPEWGRWKG